MAMFERDDVRIHYTDTGNSAGHPLLLIAPGGMRSAIELWDRAPWNPLEVLADHYRLVAMDQRNAGRSTGPVSGHHGWQTFADDQLALLDHLGIDRFHVMGMCIGGSYCMGLVRRAPERVSSAVLLQTIGLDDNRDAFHAMFDSWANDIRGDHPEASDADWQRMRASMYDQDFLFSVDREFVRACATPLLVLQGNDLYHPKRVSQEVASLAPNAWLIERWKDGDDLGPGLAAVRTFLDRHTPR